MNRLLFVALVGLLASLVPAPGRASVQDSLGHTIEEVEVRARRLSREVSATVPAQTMQRETMRSLAIQNAADAMRHFAGTTVKDYGGIGGLKTVSVRGLGANYTLQHAIDVTDPEAQGYRVQLPYTPLHSGSTRLLLATPWVNVGYSMIAASERYSMSEQIARYRIAPYAEHTLTLSRTFILYNTSLTLQAEAINLTDVQYEVIQYYPMPGRQFRLSLTVKL